MRKTTKTTKATPAKTFTASELKALTKNEILAELIKSPHGDLAEYVPVGLEASKRDPDFFAHLIAWNNLKGSIRDAKKALPTIALVGQTDEQYVENALSHLATLSPRDLVSALKFSRTLKTPQRTLRRLVERYLREKEAKGIEPVVVRHRQSLLELYAKYHVKPSAFVDSLLFKGSITTPRTAALKQLKVVKADQVAGLIGKYKLPYLSVRAALGPRAKEEDILVALIGAMSPTELVTNMKSLERLGVKTVPAARAALDAALTKAGTAKSPQALFKTTKAAEALEEAGDEQLAAKLRALQQKQIEMSKGIEGDWLIAGDASSSMSSAVEAAVQGAAYMASVVKGKVYLVFFSDTPRFFDVTGKTLEEIKKLTRGVVAEGWTSIGCSLQTIVDKGLTVDGIAVFTDGGENRHPTFEEAYRRYVQKNGNEPTVYAFKMGAYRSGWVKEAQEIDFRNADYYSLPNLMQTMRTGRYGLLDEVLATDLLTLDEVLPQTKGFKVLAGELVNA